MAAHESRDTCEREGFATRTAQFFKRSESGLSRATWISVECIALADWRETELLNLDLKHQLQHSSQTFFFFLGGTFINFCQHSGPVPVDD